MNILKLPLNTEYKFSNFRSEIYSHPTTPYTEYLFLGDLRWTEEERDTNNTMII